MSKQHIALLGRQPEISFAELEAVFTPKAVQRFNPHAALVTTSTFDIAILGGTTKAGRVILELPYTSWEDLNKNIIQHYTAQWRNTSHKITLGISAYNPGVTPRQVQALGLKLKSLVKSQGGSLRLIPNKESALGTATSHHNKLGLSDNKIELLILLDASHERVIIAESTGAQNITALARRDQARPRTDAFVGMLPPKLAMIMLNLAVGSTVKTHNASPPLVVLDPFCGTGTVLQEAVLRGFAPYGTDLSDKMVQYSTENLEWFTRTQHLDTPYIVNEGDAMTMQWQQPINFVVCETYLGQPFSAPPRPEKLRQVSGNCDHIISTFLKNIGTQIESGTRLCIAVPAWSDHNGHFTHLPLIKNIQRLGYTLTIPPRLYYRDSQVVARELLVLEKT